MRNAIAAGCAATALLFGGAGVAHATVDPAPVPSSTTTTLADNDNNNNQHSDNTGLWGLAGLLGLAGLAGLKRRNNTDATVQPAATRPPAA